jgi:hypothetical protein
MRGFAITCISVGSLVTSVLPALSDAVPDLKVEQVCRGIAQQGSDPSEKGGPDLKIDQCVKSELLVRDELTKQWSTFDSADKGHCVRETTMGGQSSYTELITCLEMARDVRKLRASPPDPKMRIER